MNAIEGGAVLPITEFFLGGGRSSHTAEQKGQPISKIDLDATNRLQETGWQVNGSILEVAKKAWETGHPAIECDPWSRPAMPERLPEETFRALDKDAKKAFADLRFEARVDVEQWRGEVSRLSDLLTIADRDSRRESLYIAYGHDSRMRRYPRISAGPNPQGDGLTRSLCRFDLAKPLGDTGLFWLASRAAGAAGLDKKTHQERAAWTAENMEALKASVRDPLGTDFWWRDEGGKVRDDHWAVLATAFELVAALESGSPGAFKSQLPVHVDGTCNGLQHLSALGLDPVGGLATNLTDDAARHDIYMMVASVVEAIVGVDAAAGLEVARGWVGKITRDLVKRGTMTTAYGVTKRGMRDQLVKDKLVRQEDHGDKDATSAAATYMQQTMWRAIGETVVAARNVMDWLQTVASTLAKANVPFEWETPTGSIIRQSYRPWLTTRPLTAFGRVHVAGTIDRTSLKPQKQALAAAPNFVHSFDAAHMALTINAGNDRGISHWATIHDSYGTHACQMETLNKVLREEFVSIYQQDWLERTWERAKEYAPSVTLEKPPVRGDFDIQQVRRSQWFFA